MLIKDEHHRPFTRRWKYVDDNTNGIPINTMAPDYSHCKQPWTDSREKSKFLPHFTPRWAMNLENAQSCPAKPSLRPNCNDMASTSKQRDGSSRRLLRLETDSSTARSRDLAEREDFRTAAAFVQGIAVINDHAERGVALIQELHQKAKSG
ncbi:hypothetical protein GWK47_030921 [Chionoecetes opilio]|uniref:Uncharacterized protein n=1 Tax=Chionoecetes opilio TaxID=41210 RepID=A0A8J4YRE1_CHIOP|nr:hypothetical protein GWK47_030921 [Chionoecetes opilio]